MNASINHGLGNPRRPSLVTKFSPFLLLLPLLLMTACATTGGGSGGAVVKRAEQRWDAVLARDYASAYEFYSPGFRSSQTPGDFELSMRLRKVHFSGAEFKEQDCQPEVCRLKFQVGYQIASPVPGLERWESTTTMEETWVRTDGQWWYLPEDG